MEKKISGEEKGLNKILELAVVGMVVGPKGDCSLVCWGGKHGVEDLGSFERAITSN